MTIEPSPETHQEATRNPNWWVYKIDGVFASHEAVPPERIVGAWKVNQNGMIMGGFLPNPNYQPKTSN